MKKSINIYDNVNLIVNTYTFLFSKLLLIIFMLLDSFYHARRVSKTAWMDEMEMEGSEICFARNTLNHNGAKMIDMECQQTYRGKHQNGSWKSWS